MRNKLLIGAVIGSVWLSAVAGAQELQEITVSAKRMVTTTVTGRSASGVPIVAVALSYHLSTAGLDLHSHTGYEELKNRVSDAALEACKQIGRQYPDATPGDDEWARVAARKAMGNVDRLLHSSPAGK